MKVVIDISDERYKKFIEYDGFMCYAEQLIKNGTPLQKGNWILQSNGKCKLPAVRFKCSNCAKISFEESNYCPRCGSKMESD